MKTFGAAKAAAANTTNFGRFLTFARQGIPNHPSHGDSFEGMHRQVRRLPPIVSSSGDAGKRGGKGQKGAKGTGGVFGLPAGYGQAKQGGKGRGAGTVSNITVANGDNFNGDYYA
jgi:hypothetical protein